MHKILFISTKFDAQMSTDEHIWAHMSTDKHKMMHTDVVY